MMRTTGTSRMIIIAAVFAALLVVAPLPRLGCCPLHRNAMARIAAVHRCCTAARVSCPSMMSAEQQQSPLLRDRSVLIAVNVPPEVVAVRCSFAPRRFGAGTLRPALTPLVLRV